MVRRDAVEAQLPDVGDVVELVTGSNRLRGTVVETYWSAIQPRVLIELENLQGSEERVTVTVPPASLAPASSSHSRWAEGYRYENALIAAIQRVLPDLTIKRAKMDSQDAGFDLSITNGTKRAIIEAKYFTKNVGATALNLISKKLRDAALRVLAEPILVTNIELHPRLQAAAKEIRLVHWAGDQDDHRLREALTSALAEG